MIHIYMIFFFAYSCHALVHDARFIDSINGLDQERCGVGIKNPCKSLEYLDKKYGEKFHRLDYVFEIVNIENYSQQVKKLLNDANEEANEIKRQAEIEIKKNAETMLEKEKETIRMEWINKLENSIDQQCSDRAWIYQIVIGILIIALFSSLIKMRKDQTNFQKVMDRSKLVNLDSKTN